MKSDFFEPHLTNVCEALYAKGYSLNSRILIGNPTLKNGDFQNPYFDVWVNGKYYGVWSSAKKDFEN